MQSDWDQVAIAGIVLFVAGLVFTARYTMRALALPDTYTGAVLLGVAITVVGLITGFVGVTVRRRQRSR